MSSFFPADYIGGDIYYSAGASLISNIPKKPHWPIKAHLWVNAGRLDALDKCTSIPSLSRPLRVVFKFDLITKLDHCWRVFKMPSLVHQYQLGWVLYTDSTL
jgi:hypothetical protein